jgi:hypothetical protein
MPRATTRLRLSSKNHSLSCGACTGFESDIREQWAAGFESDIAGAVGGVHAEGCNETNRAHNCLRLPRISPVEHSLCHIIGHAVLYKSCLVVLYQACLVVYQACAWLHLPGTISSLPGTIPSRPGSTLATTSGRVFFFSTPGRTLQSTSGSVV